MNVLDQIAHIPHGASVIAEWLGDPVVCSREEAQARADVCLECPKNKPGIGISKAVALAVKQHLAVKNQLNLRVEGEKQLQTCEACGCVLRLQIWLPGGKVANELTVEEIEQLPKQCWKLKTITEITP